jgi:hypothetical protein
VALTSIRSPLRLALTLALAVVTLTSCSSRAGGGEGGTDESSCAAMIEYGGHTYWGHGALKRDPMTTGRLVAGVLPGCDDSGGQDPAADHAEPVQVAELVDIPLDTAFLWADTIFVRDGRVLPAAARSWFRAPPCTSDGEFDVTADWLGVTGPKKPRFDGDLRPPYRLRVHVTEGPGEYVGTSVLLHADAATEPDLDARDVKESLWEGGQVAARVRCDDGRFRAVSLTVPPRT